MISGIFLRLLKIFLPPRDSAQLHFVLKRHAARATRCRAKMYAFHSPILRFLLHDQRENARYVYSDYKCDYKLIICYYYCYG